MEKFATLLLPGMLTLVAGRLFLLPIRLVYKLGIHALCGFLCLWLLSTISGFTGITIPINPATVLTAGFLGVPGIGLLAVLSLLPPV